MFAVSSGYAALAGLAAVGLPLLVLAVLGLAVALVMIPMEKPAG
jgi:hypothetical protein